MQWTDDIAVVRVQKWQGRKGLRIGIGERFHFPGLCPGKKCVTMHRAIIGIEIYRESRIT